VRTISWQGFETEIADLLAAYWFSDVRTQVSKAARRKEKQSRKKFPKQAYIETPRFDIVGRHPVLQTERVVECKEYSTPVSKDLVEGFAYRLWLCKIPTSRGIIAARPYMTTGAIKVAEQYGITYWHGPDLERRLVIGAGLTLQPVEMVRRSARMRR
jgi:hypothetical protein